MERICRIRQLPDGHNFTLMCRDLSELSTYSFVDNVAFRLMKQHAGQLYLHLEGDEGSATPSVAGKRKTIGMRVPSNRLRRRCLKHWANRCFPLR